MKPWIKKFSNHDVTGTNDDIFEIKVITPTHLQSFLIGCWKKQIKYRNE